MIVNLLAVILVRLLISLPIINFIILFTPIAIHCVSSSTIG